MAKGSPPRRELTLLDCFGLGINGIIGSGIFLLPATMYRRAGGLSPVAWLGTGALCILVALCFAEAASRTDRSGGPYRYACDAFGPHVGFAVGWITLTSSMLGYAAVARGFAEHAAWIVVRHGAPTRGAEVAIVVGLIATLGAINVLGLKPSARTSDVVGALKVLALVTFVAVGLFALRPDAFAAAPAPRPGEATGLYAAAFAGLFALTGFEYVPVPAGETQDPRRAVGLAMVLSVVFAMVLYVGIQAVTVSAAPDLASSTTPLVDAARALGGPAAGLAIAVLALVSAFGFCSGSALVGPRYVESFAQDRFLPRRLSVRTARYGTPAAAIVLTSCIVAALSTTLDFARLADTSNIAVVVQYVSTCLSILVMRRRAPKTGFRLPLGPVIPLAAAAGSSLFLLSVAPSELLLAAKLIGAGLLVGLLTRRARGVDSPQT